MAEHDTEYLNMLTNDSIVANSKEWNRANPKAFTHFGCNMLSTILKSEKAVRKSVEIIKAFTMLEQMRGMKQDDMDIKQEDVNDIEGDPISLISQDSLYRLVIADHKALQSMIYLVYDAKKETEAELKEIKQRIDQMEQRQFVWDKDNLTAKKNRTISSREAEILRSTVKKKGRDRDGMSQIWKEFKDHFKIGRYATLPKWNFDEAKEWLERR